MMWYLNTLGSIDSNRTYSHKELADILRKQRPDLSEDMCNWSIDQSTRKGLLSRQGYNTYSLSDGSILKDYHPDYSQEALKLIQVMKNRYPDVTFTVFETVLMNEFLNHLIGKNTVFLQVEKDSSIFVFRYLQELGYKNLLYNPNRKEFRLYWDSNCIVVTNLISEAPLRSMDSYRITLEKMLVDMVADKMIASTFSTDELEDVFGHAYKTYKLDKARMLRYARRRHREDKVRYYLEGTE